MDSGSYRNGNTMGSVGSALNEFQHCEELALLWKRSYATLGGFELRFGFWEIVICRCRNCCCCCYCCSYCLRLFFLGYAPLSEISRTEELLEQALAILYNHY